MVKFIKHSFLLFVIIFLVACNGNTIHDQLVDAAEEGDIALMKELVSQGADINYQSSGMLATEFTPCMAAAEEGQLIALQYLVEQGADFKKGHSGNETPITLAAKKRHQEVVLYLIDQGVDVNYQETNYGKTALLSAAEEGDVEYIKKLVTKGADLTIVDKKYYNVLMLACLHKNFEAANYFLNQGVDPNKGGPGGVTALMLAVTTQYKQSLTIKDEIKNLIDILALKGADLNQQDGVGNTAMISAASAGHFGLMKYLEKKGADPTITNNNGTTARQAFMLRDKGKKKGIN